MGLPCFIPLGAGTGAFFLPASAYTPPGARGYWDGFRDATREDKAPGATWGGGAYRCPTCGGKCRRVGSVVVPAPAVSGPVQASASLSLKQLGAYITPRIDRR
jgi:hypothetical protein